MKTHFLVEHKLIFGPGECFKIIFSKPCGVSFLEEMRWGEMTNSSILLFSFLSFSIFWVGKIGFYFGVFPSVRKTNYIFSARWHCKYTQASSGLKIMS